MEGFNIKSRLKRLQRKSRRTANSDWMDMLHRNDFQLEQIRKRHIQHFNKHENGREKNLQHLDEGLFVYMLERRME